PASLPSTAASSIACATLSANVFFPTRNQACAVTRPGRSARTAPPCREKFSIAPRKPRRTSKSSRRSNMLYEPSLPKVFLFLLRHPGEGRDPETYYSIRFTCTDDSCTTWIPAFAGMTGSGTDDGE